MVNTRATAPVPANMEDDCNTSDEDMFDDITLPPDYVPPTTKPQRPTATVAPASARPSGAATGGSRPNFDLMIDELLEGSTPANTQRATRWAVNHFDS